MKRNPGPAGRTTIMHHGVVPGATGVKRQPPALSIVRNRVFCQAGRAELQSVSHMFAMPHVQWQYPAQNPTILATRIKQTTVGSECSPMCIRQGSPCLDAQTVDNPARRQSVDIAIPDLSLPTKHLLAEGLHLDPVGVGDANQPT